MSQGKKKTSNHTALNLPQLKNLLWLSPETTALISTQFVFEKLILLMWQWSWWHFAVGFCLQHFSFDCCQLGLQVHTDADRDMWPTTYFYLGLLFRSLPPPAHLCVWKHRTYICPSWCPWFSSLSSLEWSYPSCYWVCWGSWTLGPLSHEVLGFVQQPVTCTVSFNSLWSLCCNCDLKFIYPSKCLTPRVRQVFNGVNTLPTPQESKDVSTPLSRQVSDVSTPRTLLVVSAVKGWQSKQLKHKMQRFDGVK